MKILVIEDDPVTAKNVRNGLNANFHNVDLATDGADGSFLARSYDYDAIILDYSLPKKDGLTVCKEIRKAGKTSSIIFLSINDNTDIKVAAFDSGADDYMVKPFSLEELYARLKTISKRSKEANKPVLRVGDLLLDSNKHIVTRNGKTILLTHKEFSLLEYFMQNAGKVLSRALLMEHVWSADSDPFSNTVETHIRNVRRKISPKNEPNLIKNIQSRGYKLEE